MKLEVLERHPIPDGGDGIIGRPSKVKIHAENPEEALIVRMISNSLFELNRYREADEERKTFYPMEDAACVTMYDAGRKTIATIDIDISNHHPHRNPVLS